MTLLTFTLDTWKCALDIYAVDKTYRAATITPLPQAPEIVQGIVDIRGTILPVINLRRRFSLPERKLSPSAHFIVSRTSRRPIVLLVDGIGNVIECSDSDITAADDILPALEHVEGALRLKDGIVLIQDLGKLLSLDEDAALAGAMEAL